jgi:hypothetical protein
MTQVVEQLPSKHEALSSNPTTAKKKKKKVEVIQGRVSLEVPLVCICRAYLISIFFLFLIYFPPPECVMRGFYVLFLPIPEPKS